MRTVRIAETGMIVLVLAMSSLSCGKDASGPPTPVPTALQIAQGEGQTAAVGAAVPTPIAVRVVDASGKPVGGVSVSFAVASGGGSVAAATATSDQNGLASTAWTLGTTAGEQSVSASAAGLAAVTFRATANAGPPSNAALHQGDGQTGDAGTALPTRVAIKITDAYGNAVAGANVAWEVTAGGGTVSPSTSMADAQGLAQTTWTVGTKAGDTQTLVGRAPQPAATITVTASARPGPAATVTIAPALTSITVGQTQQFSATASDVHGNAIPRPVTWTSSVGAVAAVNSQGLATAAAPGPVSVSATVDSKSATMSFTVFANAVPSIISISPDRLTRGTTFTVNGSGFSPVASANALTLEGVSLVVTSASVNQLVATVPAEGNFPCASFHSVSLNLNVPNLGTTRQVTFSSANQISLTPGQVLTLDAPSANCAEIAQQGGYYFLTIFNTSPNATGFTSFRLAGQGVSPQSVTADFGKAVRPTADDETQRRRAEHQRILALSDRAVRDLGNPPATNTNVANSLAMPVPNVGDTVRLNFPNARATSTAQLCASNIPVAGRVVYSGPKVVVLEDVTNSTAGMVDAHYQAVALEFESRQLAILESNFGNPLAFDAQLGNTGRIFMVFSKFVSEYAPGALAFVISTDMFPKSVCAASNAGQYFYAQPPASTNSTAISSWAWQLPMLAIHETYHIVNNAEHFSRNAAQREESWLNEALAQVSIELWARQIFGHGAKQNVGYASSLACERTCPGKPLAMLHPFSFVYEYMVDTEAQTMLTSDMAYGVGWLFVRWALDQYASSEAAALKAITQETQLTGVANLAARTGRSYSDMLARFALALAVDDRVTGSHPEINIPSWNLRDVYAGLNRDLPTSFRYPYPLLGYATNFGSFNLNIGSMPGGSMVYLWLTGAGLQTQLIRLQSASGGMPANNLGFAIVRAQ